MINVKLRFFSLWGGFAKVASKPDRQTAHGLGPVADDGNKDTHLIPNILYLHNLIRLPGTVPLRGDLSVLFSTF